MKLFDKLCQPAKFYFILSVISYILILLQNIGKTNRFHLGNYSCRHANPALVLICQGIYIVLWTWLLNLICKINPGISWVIVLFPFILFFILLGLLLFQGIREEFGNGALSQFTP